VNRFVWIVLTAVAIGAMRVVGTQLIRIFESDPFVGILVLALALFVGAPLLEWLKEKSNW